MTIDKDENYETMLVHGDHKLDAATGALAPPIYPSSTFAFRNAEQGASLFNNPTDGYFYTRIGNPTNDILRKKIAMMEGFDEGLTFASGMAAIHAVLISLAKAGDSIIMSDTVYGGTNNLCNRTLQSLGINFKWIDCSQIDKVNDAIDDKTRAIFIETPSNPTLKLIDIEAMADISRKNGLKLIVDNTFQTPYLQRPKQFGANVVIHSATKYLGGHGDLVAGLVVSDRDLFERLFHTMADVGGILSPFNAWLILRGIKTLHIRMRRHCENAQRIAEFLEDHPAVSRVWYPGLKSHAQYELGQKQMSGSGGIITFEIKGGREAGKMMMDSVKLWTLAVSLGDIDSLIQHPASMTHSSYTEDALSRSGITPGLIRLSVGLEHPDDLIDDLKQALKKAS